MVLPIGGPAFVEGYLEHQAHAYALLFHLIMQQQLCCETLTLLHVLAAVTLGVLGSFHSLLICFPLGASFAYSMFLTTHSASYHSL